MPKKKRATSEGLTQLSLTLGPTFGSPAHAGDLRSGLCGHINRHYFGPGECVCTLPKGHSGYHEGDYVTGNGEKMRGAWSDAAAGRSG